MRSNMKTTRGQADPGRETSNSPGRSGAPPRLRTAAGAAPANPTYSPCSTDRATVPRLVAPGRTPTAGATPRDHNR